MLSLQPPVAPLPGGHEVARLPAPAERAGRMGVVMRDGVLHCRDARLQRVDDGVPESLPGAFRIGSRHRVHPRRRHRRDGDGPRSFNPPGGCALSRACTRADLRAERLPGMTWTPVSGSGPAATHGASPSPSPAGGRTRSGRPRAGSARSPPRPPDPGPSPDSLPGQPASAGGDGCRLCAGTARTDAGMGRIGCP